MMSLTTTVFECKLILTYTFLPISKAVLVKHDGLDFFPVLDEDFFCVHWKSSWHKPKMSRKEARKFRLLWEVFFFKESFIVYLKGRGRGRRGDRQTD